METGPISSQSGWLGFASASDSAIVVSITNKYDGPPAVKVAKEVFAAMEKAGWHKAKLVDASGSPQNEANLPQTDFEKRAAEAMRAGKPYFEEVTGADA